MTERLGTTATVSIYEHMFTNNAHDEADILHREWLSVKYERIATHDILEVIDKANEAKQRYAELRNDIALLHGIGIDNEQVRTVESPVIHLATLLAGEPMTLAGRENPTAKGIKPLQARLFIAEPVRAHDEQAFNLITVEVIDPNTGDVISVISSVKDSKIDPHGDAEEYESDIIDSARRLKNIIVNRNSPVADCAHMESVYGCENFGEHPDVHTSTTKSYAELMDPDSTSQKSVTAKNLHYNTEEYANYLDSGSNELLRTIGLLEWLVESAKDGDLNPHLVERMIGVGVTVPGTVPDEYTIIFTDGTPSVVPISLVNPWTITPTGP